MDLPVVSHVPRCDAASCRPLGLSVRTMDINRHKPAEFKAHVYLAWVDWVFDLCTCCLLCSLFSSDVRLLLNKGLQVQIDRVASAVRKLTKARRRAKGMI